MKKYGSVALRAVKRAQNGVDPVRAWEESAFQPTSQEKGCPKCAFLGLVEGDFITDVPSESVTKSKRNKNRKYAIEAAKLLQISPDLARNSKKLWKQATHNQTIAHNGQMDVVLALWNAGYVRRKN